MAMIFSGSFDSDEHDDGPLGISGAMKEDIGNEIRNEDRNLFFPREDDEDPYPEE